MDIHEAINAAIEADRQAVQAKEALREATSLLNSAETRSMNAWNGVHKALQEIGKNSPALKRTDLGLIYPELSAARLLAETKGAPER